MPVEWRYSGQEHGPQCPFFPVQGSIDSGGGAEEESEEKGGRKDAEGD